MGGANGAISGNDDNSEEIYEKTGFTSDVMGDMIREIYRQSADRESKRHSNPSGEREETDNEIEDSENRKTIPVTRQRTSDRDGEESHDVKPKSFELDDLKNISGAESKNQNDENYSRGTDASPNKNVALNEILGLVVEQDGHGQDEADDKLEGAMALPLLDCSPPEPRSVNKDIVNKLADEQRVFRIKTREDGSYILVEDKAGVEPRGGGGGLGARPTGRQAWTYGQTDRGPVCETCGCVHAMSDIQPEKPLSSTEVFDVKTKSWTAGPSLPEDFSCVGLIKHKGFLCVIGTKEVEGECKRQMLKLNQEATEWVPFSTKDDDSAALSYFTGTSRADEGYAATSFVVSGMTTSRYGSLYIKGESRAWDRRPFMEDFMDDPFDALYGDVYGGTDDDDYDEYPYYDDYDDDYYDPEF